MVQYDPNNFALPDLRGRNILGAGSGPGLTSRSLGQMGGEEKHTLTINEMPAHTHTQTTRTGNQNTDNVFGTEVAANETSGTVNTGSTGGSQSHNVMDPFTVCNYIIKH
jgi:microcystin-dependent protein